MKKSVFTEDHRLPREQQRWDVNPAPGSTDRVTKLCLAELEGCAHGAGNPKFWTCEQVRKGLLLISPSEGILGVGIGEKEGKA